MECLRKSSVTHVPQNMDSVIFYDWKTFLSGVIIFNNLRLSGVAKLLNFTNKRGPEFILE